MEAPILADIIDPVAPAVAASPPYGLYAGIGILILAATWLAWKQFGKWRRERSIRLLYREFAAQQRDAHDTLFLMAGELRQRLGLHEISPEHPPENLREQDSERWRRFASRLSQWRYQTGSTPGRAEIDALFREALFWMTRCRC